MLKIRSMDIYYIRGDDDSFTIQPTEADGTAVTGYSGVFSVKQSYDDTDYVLQCQMDGAVIDLTHEMTQNLAYGDYVWDVELTLADGTHQTIGPGKFHLLPDVTT
jgi:hypothetical protein